MSFPFSPINVLKKARNCCHCYPFCWYAFLALVTGILFCLPIPVNRGDPTAQPSIQTDDIVGGAPWELLMVSLLLWLTTYTYQATNILSPRVEVIWQCHPCQTIFHITMVLVLHTNDVGCRQYTHNNGTTISFIILESNRHVLSALSSIWYNIYIRTSYVHEQTVFV